MAACSAGDPRPFCKQPTRLALSVVDPPPPDVAPSAWAGAVTLEHASVESGCRVVHFVCWEDGLDSLDWYIVRFQCLLPRSGSTIPDRQRLNTKLFIATSTVVIAWRLSQWPKRVVGMHSLQSSFVGLRAHSRLC